MEPILSQLNKSMARVDAANFELRNALAHRDGVIVELRLKGLSLREIASLTNISHQMVAKILSKDYRTYSVTV